MSGKIHCIDKAEAKSEMQKTSSKSSTIAMPSKSPKNSQTLAAKIKHSKKQHSKLSCPGRLARCPAIAGGDWTAGMLLYRVATLSLLASAQRVCRMRILALCSGIRSRASLAIMVATRT